MRSTSGNAQYRPSGLSVAPFESRMRSGSSRITRPVADSHRQTPRTAVPGHDPLGDERVGRREPDTVELNDGVLQLGHRPTGQQVDPTTARGDHRGRAGGLGHCPADRPFRPLKHRPPKALAPWSVDGGLRPGSSDESELPNGRPTGTNGIGGMHKPGKSSNGTSSSNAGRPCRQTRSRLLSTLAAKRSNRSSRVRLRGPATHSFAARRAASRRRVPTQSVRLPVAFIANPVAGPEPVAVACRRPTT